MAGKAHAAAYRNAPSIYDSVLPPIRLVSIADAYEPLAAAAAARFGYTRHDTSWHAIAAADDIDVVSVVVANRLHREIVEGLLAARKHVLCEKPLSDTIDDARAMTRAAERASSIARIGFTFHRAPALAFIRDLIASGELGEVLHFSARYWTDYAADPNVGISWRFKGPQGSGALADVGSHASYIAEFLGGPIAEVSGGRFSTVIDRRPKPLGAVSGHGVTAVSDEFDDVENDDYATFSFGYAGGGAGTIEVSRVAAGHANDLTVEVFGSKGAVRFDQARSAEIQLFRSEGPSAQRGYRTVPLGAEHPYVAGGLPIDAKSVGFGQNEGFLFQARAFLDEVAGIPAADALPRNATFEDGLHNMLLLDAVARSAAAGGASETVGA
ncbi:Gfo/Idh/MocA family oxidoreductase [Pseudoclavibacter chungangensis]|uniref:Gfo/Idh/MocA family oxidoreductase n=2 Tax=Pseudoclavibacter chungangensis TaxID=587635 RepID=A0A7J5BSS0_9MICO|nr:Gfo/Idh/MocA family oxidoreductase [Pseudoclavibacter chungangensis]KAB1657354.1 Gfo/Idh/MocA family oxidoreductase [Pseudoclavibacter chungangensis]